MSTMGKDADKYALRQRETERAWWKDYESKHPRKPKRFPRWNAKAWWGVITEMYLDWDRKI